MRKILIAAAAVAAATPAIGQVSTQGGLVNVSVTNVDLLKNFLNNDQIALLNGVQVPVTVAVPIGVAANVCGISAAVIGKSSSDPVCTARNGSKALANSFAAQKLGGQKK
ncbi:MAG: hypothetical protein ACJ8FO_02760 [Sphingomicrobium sp.]